MACTDCIRGVLNTEDTSGSIETIHGLPTYVARPDGEPKGLIVIIPDAFGWELNNSRVLADKYAKKGGFLVYLPDFMEGTGIDPWYFKLMDQLREPGLVSNLLKPARFFRAMLGFVPFMVRNRFSVRKPHVSAFFSALRLSPSTSSMKIGAAGFCWGGKHALFLAHDAPSSRAVDSSSAAAAQTPRGLVDAAFTAHPSWLSVPRDIYPVSIPLAIGVGDSDSAFAHKDVLTAKKILEKREDCEIVIYPGAMHGFAIRANPWDEKQMAMCGEVEEQAIKWFGRWFG